MDPQRRFPVAALFLALFTALALALPGRGVIAARGGGEPAVGFGVDLAGMIAHGPGPLALPPRAFRPRLRASVAGSTPPASYQIPTGTLPPIGDQGAVGSCVGWAFGYGLGSYTAALSPPGGGSGWNVGKAQYEVSPSWIYVKTIDQGGSGNPQDCPGAVPQNLLPNLVAGGTPDFAAVGYPPVANQTAEDLCDWLMNRQNVDPDAGYSNPGWIGSWNGINLAEMQESDILTDMRDYLTNNQAVAFAGPLFKDLVHPIFENNVFYPSGVDDTEAHAQLVVGYDDNAGVDNPNADPPETLGAFLVQNSWGEHWPSAAPGGRYWLSYDAFARFQTFAAVAQPVSSSSGRSTALAAIAPAGARVDLPRAEIRGALQWARPQGQGKPRAYLVILHRFSRPVRLDSVTIIEPGIVRGRGGRRLRHFARQNYGELMQNGYTHFSRVDGRSFLPGGYKVRLDGTTVDGTPVEWQGSIKVLPRPDGPALRSRRMPDDVAGTDGHPAQIGYLD
jgi:hypothetical protein